MPNVPNSPNGSTTSHIEQQERLGIQSHAVPECLKPRKNDRKNSRCKHTPNNVKSSNLLTGAQMDWGASRMHNDESDPVSHTTVLWQPSKFEGRSSLLQKKATQTIIRTCQIRSKTHNSPIGLQVKSPSLQEGRPPTQGIHQRDRLTSESRAC